MKAIVGATALVFALAGAILTGPVVGPAWAQALPNTGPAGNPTGDSYGKVYSGARPLSTKPPRYKSTVGHRHHAKKAKRVKRN